jgi:hypothetical protein
MTSMRYTADSMLSLTARDWGLVPPDAPAPARAPGTSPEAPDPLPTRLAQGEPRRQREARVE